MEKLRGELVFCTGMFMTIYSMECTNVTASLLFVLNGIAFCLRSFYIDSKLS